MNKIRLLYKKDINDIHFLQSVLHVFPCFTTSTHSHELIFTSCNLFALLSPASTHISLSTASPHVSLSPASPHISLSSASPHISLSPASPHISSLSPASPHISLSPAYPHISSFSNQTPLSSPQFRQSPLTSALSPSFSYISIFLIFLLIPKLISHTYDPQFKTVQPLVHQFSLTLNSSANHKLLQVV